MPRLSIVIPANGSMDQLESGLVSVLRHRPADAEVLIVLTEPYADPYDLAGEVEFIQAESDASLVDAVNLGLRQCESSIVHLLASGVEVGEGWTDAALRHFDDPHVAAVAPVVRDATHPQRIVSAGLDYCASGRRIERLAGGDAEQAPEVAAEILGATRTAAFYRRAALESLGSGLDASVGDDLADVDLALQLRALGMACILEPRSEVYAYPRPTARSGFSAAHHAERLFLRNTSAAGWMKSIAAHPGLVAVDFLRHLPAPGAILGLLGRMVAWFELGRARKHQQRLAQLRALLAIERPAQRGALRLHVPHAQPVPSVGTPTRTAQSRR